MNKKLISIALTSLALIAGACSGEKGWTVDGVVEGGEGLRLALEGFNNSRWYVIDSISVASNETFAYHSAKPAPYPEILRLTLDGNSIYFPVDSVSTVTINTRADNFAGAYRLQGDGETAGFMRVDSLIAASPRGEARADSLLKRQLSQMVVDPNAGLMTAYYIVNKRIDGKPLFAIENNRDLAVIGALAQRFSTERPDDPRAKILADMFIAAKSARLPRVESTVDVFETNLPAEISGYDAKGTRHSLSETVGKGKITLLSFTTYSAEMSPAYNVILAGLYDKYKDAGIEIFQIAYDPDEVAWKQTAVNLPWISIWNSPNDGVESLMKYNVGGFPVTYIIDRAGDIRQRVDNPEELAKAVAKYI